MSSNLFGAGRSTPRREVIRVKSPRGRTVTVVTDPGESSARLRSRISAATSAADQD
jgi:hypothetical protein